MLWINGPNPIANVRHQPKGQAGLQALIEIALMWELQAFPVCFSLHAVVPVRFSIGNHREETVEVFHFSLRGTLAQVVHRPQGRDFFRQRIGDELVDGDLSTFSQFPHGAVEGGGVTVLL